MKFPTSSSLLFATLAISSSSSTLAAPAVDASQYDAGIASSPSNHHVPSSRESCHKLPPPDGQQRQEELQSRGTTSMGAIPSIVDGLTGGLTGALRVLVKPQAVQVAFSESRLVPNTTLGPAPSNSTGSSSDPAVSSASAAAVDPATPSIPIPPSPSVVPAATPSPPAAPVAPIATSSPPAAPTSSS